MYRKSTRTKSRRSPAKPSSPTLRDALSRIFDKKIDPQVRQLQKASGVLACLQMQAEYGEDNVDLADVASVVIEMVDRVIRGLDSVELLSLKAKLSSGTKQKDAID